MNKPLVYSLIAVGTLTAGYFGYVKFFKKTTVEDTGTTKSTGGGGGGMGTLPEQTETTPTVTVPKPIFSFNKKPVLVAVKPVALLSKPTSKPAIVSNPIQKKPVFLTAPKPTVLTTNFNGNLYFC